MRLFKLYFELDEIARGFDKKLIKNTKTINTGVTKAQADKLRKRFESIKNALKKSRDKIIIARLKSCEVLVREIEFLSKGRLTRKEIVDYYRENYQEYFYNYYFCEKGFSKYYNVKKNPGFFKKAIDLNMGYKDVISDIDLFLREFCKKYRLPYNGEIKNFKVKYDKNGFANFYKGILIISPKLKKITSWSYLALVHEVLGHGFHEVMIEKLCKKKEARFNVDMDFSWAIMEGFAMVITERYIKQMDKYKLKQKLQEHNKVYLKYCKFRGYCGWKYLTNDVKGLTGCEKVKILQYPAYKEIYYPSYILVKRMDLKKLRKFFAMGYATYQIAKSLIDS